MWDPAKVLDILQNRYSTKSVSEIFRGERSGTVMVYLKNGDEVAITNVDMNSTEEKAANLIEMAIR